MLNKAYLILIPLAIVLGSCSSAASEPSEVMTTTAPVKPAPTILCKRAIVVDYATGKVLYAKNAMEQCHIASLQKMLTALCIQERGYTSKKLKVTAYDTKVVPSKLYIKPGHSYTRSSLVKALLVKSGNDVARALARDAAGSEEKFSVLMNNKAKALGMRRSVFKNPHGLTQAGQFSCAYDAAILARAAYYNKTLRAYMRPCFLPLFILKVHHQNMLKTDKVRPILQHDYTLRPPGKIRSRGFIPFAKSYGL